MSFDIVNRTTEKINQIHWRAIKNEIIGESYELSLVFANDKLIKKLNSDYRKINKSTTILSFSLSKSLGEIFISISGVKKEARKYKTDFNVYLKMLFIHGLLHLKGFNHGAKMEIEERKLLKIDFKN